jgi:hypothetical protein
MTCQGCGKRVFVRARERYVVNKLKCPGCRTKSHAGEQHGFLDALESYDRAAKNLAKKK